jgi:hypothetical protein
LAAGKIIVHGREVEVGHSTPGGGRGAGIFIARAVPYLSLPDVSLSTSNGYITDLPVDPEVTGALKAEDCNDSTDW